MALRYFRNTGSTSYSVTTNWSATDGGVSVGAVPTAADDVYFTSNSGNCVINATSVAKTITCTGYIGTISGSSQLTVSGSITLVSGMGWTYTGNLIINAASTILLAGKAITQLTLSNVAITINPSDSVISLCTISQVGSTIQFASNALIKSLISIASTSASHNIIKSSSVGVKRQLGVFSADLSFVDFTDIDATLGPTVRTYKGVISNCFNVVNMIPPTQKGNINF